ncbi:MAG: hypothetical protein ACSLE5_15355 [Porticoccaceae bacterium]
MALDDLLARLEGRAVTPVTPTEIDGVTAKPAQSLACTPVTPVTPKKNNTGADANPPTPLSAQTEATIRAWLEYIGETDPEEIARVWDKCRTIPSTLAYVLGLAAEVEAEIEAHDDRL